MATKKKKKVSAATMALVNSSASRPRNGGGTKFTPEQFAKFAAAFAGGGAAAAQSAGDPLANAQTKLLNSISAINNSNAPVGSKLSATNEAPGQKKKSENFLEKALNTITKPKTWTVATIANLIDSDRNFLKDLRDNVGTGDVLAGADWYKDLPTPAKLGVSIAGDIALDPLTYLAPQTALSKVGGAAGLSRVAGEAAVAAKAAGKIDDAVRLEKVAGQLLQKGKGGIGGLGADDLAWISKTASKELGALGITKPLRGGLYLNAPGTGRLGSFVSKKLTGEGIEAKQLFLGRGPVVEKISAGASNTLGKVKTSGVMSSLGDKYGGGFGARKRDILNADTPQKALFLQRDMKAFQAGEGAAAQFSRQAETRLVGVLKKVDQGKLSPQQIFGAMDGNVDDIRAVDRLVPGFSTHAREIDDALLTGSQEQLARTMKAAGLDPNDAEAFTRLQENHVRGRLTDEARDAMDAANALGKPKGGKEAFQMNARYEPGADYMGKPLSHPTKPITRVYYEAPDGSRQLLMTADNKPAISFGADDAAADAARKSAGEVLVGSEKAAKKFGTTDGMVNTRVYDEATGRFKQVRVPESQIRSEVLAPGGVGAKTQVNAITRERNGYDLFNTDWVGLAHRQINEVGTALSKEVRAQILRKYGYAAGFDMAKSKGNALAVIERKNAAFAEAILDAQNAGSARLAFEANAGKIAAERADELAANLKTLDKAIAREASSSPKAGQLRNERAALELELQDQILAVDQAERSHAAARETLRGLRQEASVARQSLAAARGTADEAAATARLGAAEEALAQADAAPMVADNAATVVPDAPSGQVSALGADDAAQLQASDAFVTQYQESLASIAEMRGLLAEGKLTTAEITRRINDVDPGRWAMNGTASRSMPKGAKAQLDQLEKLINSAIARELENPIRSTSGFKATTATDPIPSLYHGSSSTFPDGNIGDGAYYGRAQMDNLVGGGFYTTDDAQIANSYMKKGAKGSDSAPSVYDVQWTGANPPRVLDLNVSLVDQSIVERVQRSLYGVADRWEIQDEAIEGISDMVGKSTLYELFGKIREVLGDAGERIVKYEADEFITDAVTDPLREAYDVLRHTGGVQGGKSHNVYVWINEGDVAATKTGGGLADNAAAAPETAKAAVGNNKPAQKALESVADDPAAVQAVSKTAEAQAAERAKLPAEPADFSVLSLTPDEEMAHLNGVLAEVRAKIGSQTSAVKGRATTVTKRQAVVDATEARWAEVDAHIDKLDEAYAKVTARMVGEAKAEVADLAEQIVNIKNSARILRDAEARSLRMLDTRMDEAMYARWMHGPKANQEFANQIREGWVAISHTTQATAETAEIMAQLTRSMGPDQLPGVFRYFDKATTVFKSWAIASPGFIMRNGVGGMFNNYLLGVDPGRYADFLKADRAFLKVFNRTDDVERAMLAVPAHLREDYRLVHASGVLSGTDRIQDAAFGLVRDLGEGGQRSAGVLADNPVTRGVYSLNGRMERVLRGSAAMDGAAKTKSLDGIYDIVFKAHFDYSDLNRFEINVMKRVSPFYTWTRKNLPLQMEMIFRNPKAVDRYMIFKNNIESITPPEDIVPQWMEDRMGIRLPFSTKGGQMYVLPDLPFASLNLLTNLDEVAGQVNPVIKTPLEMAFNRKMYFGKSAPFTEGFVQMSPVLEKTGIGAAMEMVGLAERDKDGTLVTRDKTLYAVEQFLPFFGKMRRLLPSEKKYDERAATTWLNFVFGAGLRTNTDTDKAGEIRSRQVKIDAMAKDLQTLGYGGYSYWEKRVETNRKPTDTDKRPYLTLSQPKGGLGSNSPYSNVATRASKASKIQKALEAIAAQKVSTG